MGSYESHFNVSLIMRDKVTRPQHFTQTTTFLKKKESWSRIELRPFCFKPAHKPSHRLPLVIPPDNSGKGVGLWMGLCGECTSLSHTHIHTHTYACTHTCTQTFSNIHTQIQKTAENNHHLQVSQLLFTLLSPRALPEQSHRPFHKLLAGIC